DVANMAVVEQDRARPGDEAGMAPEEVRLIPLFCLLAGAGIGTLAALQTERIRLYQATEVAVSLVRGKHAPAVDVSHCHKQPGGGGKGVQQPLQQLLFDDLVDVELAVEALTHA